MCKFETGSVSKITIALLSMTSDEINFLSNYSLLAFQAV